MQKRQLTTKLGGKLPPSNKTKKPPTERVIKDIIIYATAAKVTLRSGPYWE